MITNSSAQSGKILFKMVGILIAVVVLITVIGYAAINLNFGEKNLTDKPTYVVQEGPLVISATVSGTIQAREKVIIKSELEGSNAILYIVPEGSHVKANQLLVELDASTLQDQRVDQQIKVQNAEASYISSRENLEIVKNQAKSDVEKAQLSYELAQLDLDKYQKGDFPKAQKQAETNITLSEEEVNRSEDVEKWSKILFDEKYLSQTELQRDTITAKKAKLSLDLAEVDLNLLKQFTYKRQIAELKSSVSQAQMALDRVKRKASANIVQASAELQAKKSEYDQQITKIKKIDDQISKAKIYAPMDGLVVYATSVQADFFRNQEPLEEGQMVRERQELIHLPTTSSYIAEVKVHESSLEKIRLGLPARITIDALPGKVYYGKVSNIAPLPDAQSVFMNPDLKVYRTEIQIEGNGEDLRSGMSCQADIIVDQFEDTTYVPVLAVVRKNNQPTVYVVQGNKITPRVVELGPDNNRIAQIKSGLNKGEVVLLTPPLASSHAASKENEEMNPELKQMLNDSKNNQGGGGSDSSSRPNMGRQGSGPNPSGNQMRPQGQGQRGGIQGSPGGSPGSSGRPDFQNMSSEQREQMRQRFRNNSGGTGSPGGRNQGSRGQRGPRPASQ